MTDRRITSARPGVRLGIEEREAIGLGLARGEPLAQIARRLWPADVDGQQGSGGLRRS